jgi:hypothetical protein
MYIKPTIWSRPPQLTWRSYIIHHLHIYIYLNGGRRGRDCMVVGFTTTYAISTYHHWKCEFESHVIQHYVIKFVSNIRQVDGFLWVLRFPPPLKLNATINWNIVEGGVKHYKQQNIIKHKFKQRWTTQSLISTKRTITSHLDSMNIDKTTTYGSEYSGSGLWQAQNVARLNH